MVTNNAPMSAARAAEAEAAETDFLAVGDSRTSLTTELTVIRLLETESFLILGKDITPKTTCAGHWLNRASAIKN